MFVWIEYPIQCKSDPISTVRMTLLDKDLLTTREIHQNGKSESQIRSLKTKLYWPFINSIDIHRLYAINFIYAFTRFNLHNTWSMISILVTFTYDIIIYVLCPKIKSMAISQPSTKVLGFGTILIKISIESCFKNYNTE